MTLKIKQSFILCIICDVMLAFAVLIFIRYSVLLSTGSDIMFGLSNGAFESLPSDGDNPGGGFELIFGLAGGAFTGIAGIIASALSFLMLIPAVTCGIILIVSIVLLILHKNMNRLSYLSGNCIMLIVLSALYELLLLVLVIGTFSLRTIILFLVNPFSAVIIMSAAALAIIRKEKKKAASGMYFTTEK